MNNLDKLEAAKDAVINLYCKEGRSKGYIAKLFNVSRHSVQKKVREWHLIPAEPVRHLTPSEEKFVKRNKPLILSRLKHNQSMTSIAKELNITRQKLLFCIQSDKPLSIEYEKWEERKAERKQTQLEIINRFTDDIHRCLPNEQWKPILGFPNFEISNKGRLRQIIPDYDNPIKTMYIPVPTWTRPKTGHIYCKLKNTKGNIKTLQVSNIVGHTFVPGFDENHTTIAFRDKNPANNNSTNLYWKENEPVKLEMPKNKWILYKNQYRFKTIHAFQRFLKKSDKDIHQMLQHPTQNNIQFIDKSL